MRKIKIVYLLVLGLLFFGFTNADNVVTFDSFVNDIDLVKKSKRNISVVKFFADFNQIKNNECEVDRFNQYVEVSPICLLNKSNILKISTDEALNYLLDDLIGFGNYYQDKDMFFYKPVKPQFYHSVIDEYNGYNDSIYKKVVITYLENNNFKIRIDKSILAKMNFYDYSFYVVPTYLANRSHCSLTNYRAAVSHLEGFELKPNQELDLNNLISYDPNSCKGTTSKKYMFYAGACGSSTQLFRLSLIMPNLDVVERYPHSKWRSFYYGNKIYGDDAAMYENSKKFIVKNDFDESIYFKVYEQGNNSYLVGVVPKKIDDIVEVNKTNYGLNSSVYKNIYSGDGDLVEIYRYDSSYSSYYYGRS
ncbi:MAG TPA: VanW family protein [Candidatus Absconditabacterales bacterium]|nr:VanW family protein [Candidatus Absconditabacterales bacterium]